MIDVNQIFQNLIATNDKELAESGFKEGKHQKFLNLRYEGTDTSIMVSGDDNLVRYVQGFEESHKREFGFNLEKRKIIIDNVRVRSVGNASVSAQKKIEDSNEVPKEISSTETYFEEGMLKTKIYDLLELKSGMVIDGPVIILNNTSTILVEP